jgi:hypothetical protein
LVVDAVGTVSLDGSLQSGQSFGRQVVPSGAKGRHVRDATPTLSGIVTGHAGRLRTDLSPTLAIVTDVLRNF